MGGTRRPRIPIRASRIQSESINAWIQGSIDILVGLKIAQRETGRPTGVWTRPMDDDEEEVYMSDDDDEEEVSVEMEKLKIYRKAAYHPSPFSNPIG